jgi:hypothetical protein
MRTLDIAKFGMICIGIFFTEVTSAQSPSNAELQKLNVCLATARKQPANQEDIIKGMNQALTDPDKASWCFFLYVNSSAVTPGNNDALFETWASDGQTFDMNPQWPGPGQLKELRPNILLQVRDSERNLQFGKLGGAIQPFIVPPPRPLKEGDNLEETRRNKAAFDFIVNNDLYKITGLKKAFAKFASDNKLLAFPADAIEVKANWFPVINPSDPTKSGIPGYNGTPQEARKLYHINKAKDGKEYALVAMHIISKMVPNWTWATFEHQSNPGRCEFIGCRDTFGSTQNLVAPDTTIPDPSDTSYKNVKNNPTPYPPCVKSEALEKLFAQATIDPAFKFYCLKGSQTDFTDATGMPTRLGNSITEETFDFQASCMTCHSRASFGSDGTPNTTAGFDSVTGAPLGAMHGEWYWSTNIGGPWPPAATPVGATQVVGAVSADFVWSVPFCAIDDTKSPPPKSRCAGK